MGITGSVDIGQGLKIVTVDHDPAVVATNVPAGSIIIDTDGGWYRKMDSSPSTNVSKRQLRKVNDSATTDPTINDDFNSGYQVLSCWVNTTSKQCFVCTDSTVGAAVWSSMPAGNIGHYQFYAVNGNDFYPGSSYATVVVAANADIHITFAAPSNMGRFGKAYVIILPTQTSTNKTINITTQYAAIGEQFNTHTANTNNLLLDFVQGQMKAIDITSMLSSLAAGDFVGVYVKQNSIGQYMHYLGVYITFQ